jgi:hypothetical protein
LEIAAARIGAAVSTQCRRRVFVSAPEDKPLTAGHKALKDGVIEKIKEAGYFPEMFNRSEARSFADGKPWSLPHLHSVVSRCVGAVIIGLPREVRGQKLQFTSELCHLEGGVAYELDIPLFVLADEEIKDRGIFKEGDDFFVVCVPREAGVSWLETDQLFCRRFDQWLDKLEARYDVFLGYCGCASRTASLVKGFLSELGVTVLDWKADFAPSNMILDQIRKAAARCSSGVFLFTKDDPIESDANQIAPRDNVVFEAGFFLSCQRTAARAHNSRERSQNAG